MVARSGLKEVAMDLAYVFFGLMFACFFVAIVELTDENKKEGE